MPEPTKPKAPFDWKLNADQTLVTIEPVEKPTVLDGPQVQVVAQRLGHIRALLRPPIPAGLSQQSSLAPLSHFLVDPNTSDPPVETGCKILVRSEHFGWFALPLSAEGAKDLAQKLLEKPPAPFIPPANRKPH
jgi:hypothetical protein